MKSTEHPLTLARGAYDRGMKNTENSKVYRSSFVDAVRVLGSETLPNGVRVVTVPCPEDHRTFVTLPAAFDFDGARFGKTAFNSDCGVAYYRTDAALAWVR